MRITSYKNVVHSSKTSKIWQKSCILNTYFMGMSGAILGLHCMVYIEAVYPKAAFKTRKKTDKPFLVISFNSYH